MQESGFDRVGSAEGKHWMRLNLSDSHTAIGSRTRRKGPQHHVLGYGLQHGLLAFEKGALKLSAETC